jgi:hypothetical protein
MKAEAKKQWVEALRSGKYRRGKSLLSPDGKTFCCLGVLCEINNVKFAIGITAFLPEKFEREVGLPREIQEQLASLNDGDADHLKDEQVPLPKGFNADRGANFKQIAAWVDAYVPDDSTGPQS